MLTAEPASERVNGTSSAMQLLAAIVVDAHCLRWLAGRVIVTHQQHAFLCPGHAQQKLYQAADGVRQRHRVAQRGGRLHQRQDLFDGLAECQQGLMQPAGTTGRADVIELLAHGQEKRLTRQVVILVEVIAHAHAHGIQRRCLVGIAGDQNGRHFRMECRQVLQELQAVIARPQGPVEDRQVDGVLVGQRQGRLGVVSGEDGAVEPGAGEPFLKGPPHRLFVVDNQHRFAIFSHGGCPCNASAISLLISGIWRAREDRRTCPFDPG